MSSSDSSKHKNTQKKADQRITPNHTFIIGRFGVIFTITTVIALAIAFMLIRTTTVHAKAWNQMGLKTLSDSAAVEPFRGEILACDGSILATNLYYFDIMMDLRADGFKIIEFDKAIPELCDSLAKYFPPYDAEAWQKKIKAQMDLTKKERTRCFVIAKAVPSKMVDKVKTFPFFREFKKSTQTGLKADPVLKRAYPFGKMARLSIGRVGMTDTTGTQVRGRSGLECALDTLLYGVPGLKRKRLSNKGTKMVVERPAINGYDVYTTIDIRMQDILESELGDMLLKSDAEWGSAMLMEVATGDIKAISNLERDKKSVVPRYIEALNRCVKRYEPGSVMKVMTMAVGLEKGFAKPINRELQIGRTYMYLNRKLQDTHSPGSLPISRFIEYSSNIGMVKISTPYYEGRRKQFKADLADMGFFDRFNTGIAREIPPSFPGDPSKMDLSRMVFGYSTMIPPLYTCAFYNAVANDGRFVRPRLVKGLRTPEGRDSMIPVSYVRDRILSSENAAILRKMIRGVVWENGGTAKVLQNDLVEIAGKTGTSKIALEFPTPQTREDSLRLKNWKGGYMEGHYRVTFCGFFPYENPKYTCIVVINDPKIPYRGPAVSSGVVLKNVALKLYARNMLTDNPEFEEDARANQGPVVYSSFNDGRNSTLHTDLQLGKTRAIKRPAANDTAGTVPDVKGVSIREALTCLEEHGYEVDFSGVGYVYAQSPEAGTAARPGTKVKLSLRYD